MPADEPMSREVRLAEEDFDTMLNTLARTHRVLAPVRLRGRGRFSDQDAIRYGEVRSLAEIVHDEQSHFSPKEVIFPVTQTLYYLYEDVHREPSVDTRGIILFLRACDIHGIERLDTIFLRNGPEPDSYYARLREKVKFVLMECRDGFENCFCVSMGTNRTDEYAMAVRFENGSVLAQVRDEALVAALPDAAQPASFTPEFPTANPTTVTVPDPDALRQAIREKDFFDHPMWEEYGKRCIACGRCNTHCVSCSCFTSHDVAYDENANAGERRRVWAGCHIDRFTDMAGGHTFRKEYGARMRFKAMHKIYDYYQRFGSHMCVGCGRCDTHCPEYISFAACINAISQTLVEEDGHE